MDLLLNLISSFDPENPNFRPTEIYNENWLLKIVLQQLSTVETGDYPLGFLPESSWFSEGLLPTAFQARYRGDPRAESRTSADGVVGHIRVGVKAKADLELEPDASQFSVVEAKLRSPLAKGVAKAPYFDQAARNTACMAEVLKRGNIQPGQLTKLDFIVLAPAYSIKKGTFQKQMQHESICEKVQRRIAAYEGDMDSWYSQSFEPLMKVLHLHILSWEEVIGFIGSKKPGVRKSLDDYYERCLE